MSRGGAAASLVAVGVLSMVGQVALLRELAVASFGVELLFLAGTAVFLPQVATEQGWGKLELLDHLCEKAGLSAGCWREGAALSAFQAEVFGEAHRP